ncbi:MAG: sigma-54-dependent Fis family transcriptional regulator [Ignavibacteriae bacterium]|nr:MAG: sigma-54-dependent Fis family transcriptional regulator [Ignavibacteriota bacterium]
MNENIKILVVDDEVNSTKLLKKVLARKGYAVDESNDSSEAQLMIKENTYNIVISDLQMPKLSGLDLLKTKPADCIFIMITGYGSVNSAVESMKLGAYDYINKPFNLEEFIIKVDKAAEKINLTNQLRNLRTMVEENYSFSSIVGKSKKMQVVFEFIKNVSKTNVNVLVEGPSGTGKELVSRAIHYNSPRKNGPFVAINCSAIPENLLESEMFGHIRGAFTGAVETQKGVFEQANGGTLLLDEIAEMPFSLQAKLLRVLETWEIKALGSDKVKRVDIRLISATNQNLKEMIKQKKFREDLYYRITTVTLTLPSLNERKDDIPLLVDYYLKKLGDKLNRTLSITPEAINILMKYDWKGNVRELENILERAVITSENDKLNVNEFKFLQISENAEENPFSSLDNVGLKEIERLYIKKILEENNWNKLKVAQILGIDRKTLYKKIKEYGFE